VIRVGLICLGWKVTGHGPAIENLKDVGAAREKM
jgi:hypothetical protein